MVLCIAGSREICYATPELIFGLVQASGIPLSGIESVITRGDPGFNVTVQEFVDYYNYSITSMAFSSKNIQHYLPEGLEMVPMSHGGINPVTGSQPMTGPEPNIISCRVYYPNYQDYKELAGRVRDKKMMEDSDQLLIVWDMEDKEDKQLKKYFLENKKPVHEVSMCSYRFKQKELEN